MKNLAVFTAVVSLTSVLSACGRSDVSQPASNSSTPDLISLESYTLTIHPMSELKQLMTTNSRLKDLLVKSGRYEEMLNLSEKAILEKSGPITTQAVGTCTVVNNPGSNGFGIVGTTNLTCQPAFTFATLDNLIQDSITGAQAFGSNQGGAASKLAAKTTPPLTSVRGHDYCMVSSAYASFVNGTFGENTGGYKCYRVK